MITSVDKWRNSSMLLLLMFWNWTSSMRSSRPLALGAELHIADHGLERGLAHVVGEHVVLGALGRLDRLTENLQIGVGPHRHVIAERIDALGRGARLILLEQLHRSRELQRRGRDPGLVIDDAVQQRPE